MANATSSQSLNPLHMDLVNHLEGRLLFAVPKKGRLQGPTLDLLAGADIKFRREHRLDIALVTNLDIALVFLPAADIPTFVGEGRVDLGITGQDTVAEYMTSSLAVSGDNDAGAVRSGGIEEVMDLGFGKCKLQVQVPEKGGIQESKDLVGKHVVTSFTGLTEKFFADLEGLKRTDEQDLARQMKTKVMYVGGSVEAACALGVADGIVDLVESGETMKAAGLKAIDTVIESSAVLIRSKRTSNPKLVDLLAARIRGVINAQRFVLCTYNIPKSKLSQATKITPGKRAPTVTSLEEEDWSAVSVMVEKKKMAGTMDELDQIGATDILIMSIMNSRTD